MTEILTRGGVYLAKLNPSKKLEVGKVRPVVILTSQMILDIHPPIIYICPLSSQSFPEFASLHVPLVPRDNLKASSYALTEHCRAISIERLTFPRIAQLTIHELNEIIYKWRLMIE